MCRKLAFAATALVLAWPAAASAWPFGHGKPPAAATNPAQAGQGATNLPAPPEATPAPRKATGEERAEADRMDALARAAFWGRVVETDPRDVEAGGKLAKALRELGRFDEAGAAADHVLIIEPNNLAALLETARAKIGANQGFFAIDPAQRAAAIAPKDWRPVALLAVALEQAQRDDEALATHQRALALAPNNPALMSNLGMYLATHGDAAQGETLLRRAVATPGAPAQVRQNLALILGLQGRMAEAERLARQDLPPSVVANNLAYLQAAQKADATTARSWEGVSRGQ
jgi:Flp pilus assembly protein TadD